MRDKTHRAELVWIDRQMKRAQERKDAALALDSQNRVIGAEMDLALLREMRAHLQRNKPA